MVLIKNELGVLWSLHVIVSIFSFINLSMLLLHFLKKNKALILEEA